MYILHISDLHFGTKQDANRWYGQLADDLRRLLSQLEPNQSPHLDALIISGDMANRSTPKEYAAAERFIHRLLPEFGLQRHQIVIVPGNHDLNWDLSKQAYEIKERESYDGSLEEEKVLEKSIIVDGEYIHIPDETEYKRRFQYFSDFYKNVIGKPYQLEYEQQYELRHFPEHDLLVLGLNSAWQINHDKKYRSRASINLDTLNNALEQIEKTPGYKKSKLKIAVWHHLLESQDEDRIKDHDFMKLLAANNFRLVLHGHINPTQAEYHYRMVSKIDLIAAGTFGVPIRKWFPGYPLQYNLLKLQGKRLTVYNRKRIKPNEVWQPDAQWFHPDEVTASSYYEIDLHPSRQRIQPFPSPPPPDLFHYEQVAEAIKNKEIVPFLGPGINLYGRKGDANKWQLDDPYPPSKSELAVFLEKRILGEEDYFLTGVQCPLCDPTAKNLPSNCPIRINALFARLNSQHVSELRYLGHGGIGVLERTINSIFRHSYPPNQLHKFLAQLWGKYQAPKLIVTANFDSTLEVAFQEESQPFDLVSYGGSKKGFIYQRFRENKETGRVERVQEEQNIIKELDEEDLDFSTYPIILKLYGPVDWHNTREENFAITEDHFIDYLALTAIGKQIPASLLDELRNCSIWFLGYGLSHWDERVILHRIWSNQEYKDVEGRPPWWAIQNQPQQLDQYLWDQAKVELFSSPLENYISELRNYI